MTTNSRWKWIALPAALIVGAVGGSGATMLMSPRAAKPDQPGPRAEAKAPPVSPGDLEPPLMIRDGHVDFDPPPGFFDLPGSNKGDGTDPPILKPGQILLVEVLEALPGRPITGERVVRPDGTISLGFYGDLRVAGLNRLQIKVKVVELLRKFVNDETLGLIGYNPQTGKNKLVMPVDSNRLFVDESDNYFPSTASRAGRPTASTDPGPGAGPPSDRIGDLERKLEAVLETLRPLHAPVVVGDPSNPPATTPR